MDITGTTAVWKVMSRKLRFFTLSLSLSLSLSLFLSLSYSLSLSLSLSLTLSLSPSLFLSLFLFLSLSLSLSLTLSHPLSLFLSLWFISGPLRTYRKFRKEQAGVLSRCKNVKITWYTIVRNNNKNLPLSSVHFSSSGLREGFSVGRIWTTKVPVDSCTDSGVWT